MSAGGQGGRGRERQQLVPADVVMWSVECGACMLCSWAASAGYLLLAWAADVAAGQCAAATLTAACSAAQC